MARRATGQADARRKAPGAVGTHGTAETKRHPDEEGTERVETPVGQAASDRQGDTAKDVPLDDLKKRLGYSETGLAGNEVRKRLEQYGYNELAEARENIILKLLSYFWGPIPIMILIAAVLSMLLRHWPDVGIIMALLVMNAVVGFREEYQANNTIAALKEKLATKARVKRDGSWSSIPARELVPGDLIRLRLGEIVPADARLLEGDSVEVDQSALTGESLPVERKTGDAVFSGSVLRQGEIEALVSGTGQNTFYGKTAQLVQETKTQSHLQKAVIRIADFLIVIAVSLAILIFIVSLFRGERVLTVLEFALVLTIAAVPVAMPAVLSITMALGARVLAEKKAIVTHLPAVEELAGVDVLCSDKTGTLTQNKLTLADPFTVRGTSSDELIQAAALASRAEDQDPIDLAVLDGLQDDHSLEGFRVEHFVPFDPVHKRTEATAQHAGEEFKTTKGAPQVILALDPDAGRIQKEVDQAVSGFAERGYRSLGVARTDGHGEWRFLGVLPLYDPLREDSKDTVTTAREMGLAVKMATGDQLAIAKEIARELDLGQNIVDASVFGDVKHHETGQAADIIEKADGFAQVFPEHKYHIVDVLQQRNHIVGMTGDGVNDAPALKKADAGIAVAGATDAARSAADVVLLLPGLSVIVDAIKESRKIFQRMTSYAIYRIAETIALLGFITLAILIFQFYPVTAIMIVLLAILNDGSMLSIAYDRTHYRNQPEAWDMRMVLGMASVLGVYAVFRSFGIFYIGDRIFTLSQDEVRTLVYLNLVVGGILTLYAARVRGPFWSVKPANLMMAATFSAAIIGTLLAGFGALMTKLPWVYVGFVWGYSIVLFFIQDLVSIYAYRILGREQEHSGMLVKLART